MSVVTNVNSSSGASLGIYPSGIDSQLMSLLEAEAIVPGKDPSYQTCKILYSYHPLGAKMAESPVSMALSQERELSIPVGPEDELKEAFEKTWKTLGKIGANSLVFNLMVQARIYGISSMAVGARDKDPSKPLPFDDEKFSDLDLYFSIFDPLNTAGSLVLDQNPLSPTFQRPKAISVSGVTYAPDNTVIMMNEMPIYILWTSAAFGFSGRSVYQRALYPLKSFVQTMITDDLVAIKAGALIYKSKSPGSTVDNLVRKFQQAKAWILKQVKSGNVATIGLDEDVISLNFQNLEAPYRLVRENILNNIAAAAGMPAVMLREETMAQGFGEGTEDAKLIARYIDRLRIEMAPIYRFLDDIVMRKAWTPALFESIRKDRPEYYGKMTYRAAFQEWKNAFKATWPNLLIEPDSEKSKTEDVILKAAIGAYEVLAPNMDPENKATLSLWLADCMNERKILFSSPLVLDEEALKSYEPPQMGQFGETEGKEPTTRPEGIRLGLDSVGRRKRVLA